MKRVCTQCERISIDGNLWCQERDCPAGATSVVLGYGETMGDIEVTRLVRVINTAALYEARRGDEQLLLKVAHEGCQEQLKREATALAQVNGQHPMLPVLLPPVRDADLKQRPYGKTVFRGETKYYELFSHVEGEFLRDLLMRNPQPWYLHSAWIITSIADALAFLHVKVKKLHLNLSPDEIFIRYDIDGIPRPVLLDLGVVGDLQGVDIPWLYQYGQPAYMPPEIVDRTSPPSFASDVYGLGLVLYEMLAGQPAFQYKQQRDDDVRAMVAKTSPAPLNRTDLSDEILSTIYQALEKTPANRQPDVRTFAKTLRARFGEVPAERKRKPVNRKILAALVAAVLVFIVLLLVASLLP